MKVVKIDDHGFYRRAEEDEDGSDNHAVNLVQRLSLGQVAARSIQDANSCEKHGL